VIVPCIDDPRIRVPGLVEPHLAGHEIGVADVGGRRDQAVDVDLRALREHDAARVDDHQTAIGAQRAGDRRGIGRVDAVQGPGAAGRLVELGALADRDVEALPIDDGAVGRLHDIDLDRARIRNRRAAAGDLAALRVGAGRPHCQQQPRGREAKPMRAISYGMAARLANAAGISAVRHGHTLSTYFLGGQPDQEFGRVGKRAQ
jgi:hypothetical protein